MIASLSENFSNGGLTLIKTLGAVAASAVLLYVILLLVRVLGSKLERKTYDKYAQKCREQGEEPIVYEEYVSRRSKGEKVLWKREDLQTSTVHNEPNASDKHPERDSENGSVSTQVDESSPLQDEGGESDGKRE